VPLYEYKCLKCGRNTEKIEPVSGPHLRKCPHCGGKVESVITAPSIQFKGTGWYVTDYAGKSSAKTAATEGSGGDGKDSGGKESGRKDSSGKDAGGKDSAGKESAGKESKGTEAKEAPAKEKKTDKKR
jgi:putative FmdB family regulatory protein